MYLIIINLHTTHETYTHRNIEPIENHCYGLSLYYIIYFLRSPE